MSATTNPPQIPLEERAYLEFARRKGFSTKTDADGRPLLRGLRLFNGFVDAYTGEPRKKINPAERFDLSDQSEYDVGYDGGMYAGFAGEDYFRQPN